MVLSELGHVIAATKSELTTLTLTGKTKKGKTKLHSHGPAARVAMCHQLAVRIDTRLERARQRGTGIRRPALTPVQWALTLHEGDPTVIPAPTRRWAQELMVFALAKDARVGDSELSLHMWGEDALWRSQATADTTDDPAATGWCSVFNLYHLRSYPGGVAEATSGFGQIADRKHARTGRTLSTGVRLGFLDASWETACDSSPWANDLSAFVQFVKLDSARVEAVAGGAQWKVTLSEGLRHPNGGTDGVAYPESTLVVEAFPRVREQRFRVVAALRRPQGQLAVEAGEEQLAALAGGSAEFRCPGGGSAAVKVKPSSVRADASMHAPVRQTLEGAPNGATDDGSWHGTIASKGAKGAKVRATSVAFAHRSARALLNPKLCGGVGCVAHRIARPHLTLTCDGQPCEYDASGWVPSSDGKVVAAPDLHTILLESSVGLKAQSTAHVECAAAPAIMWTITVTEVSRASGSSKERMKALSLSLEGVAGMQMYPDGGEREGEGEGEGEGEADGEGEGEGEAEAEWKPGVAYVAKADDPWKKAEDDALTTVLAAFEDGYTMYYDTCARQSADYYDSAPNPRRFLAPISAEQYATTTLSAYAGTLIATANGDDGSRRSLLQKPPAIPPREQLAVGAGFDAVTIEWPESLEKSIAALDAAPQTWTAETPAGDADADADAARSLARRLYAGGCTLLLPAADADIPALLKKKPFTSAGDGDLDPTQHVNVVGATLKLAAALPPALLAEEERDGSCELVRRRRSPPPALAAARCRPPHRRPPPPPLQRRAARAR